MDPNGVDPESLLRFVHVEPFPGQWSRLGLKEDDLRALEILLIESPLSGRPIPGTGGVRKVRFSAPGADQGKRGAYRVFYKYFPDHGTVILWAVIAKGQSENLSVADRNGIAKQAERLKRLLDQGMIR